MKNQPQRKVGEHIPCGYLMSMIWILNGIENKNDVYKKNTEKYKTFSVPVTKEVKRIGKTGEETSKSISYRLQLVDSTKFWQAYCQILLIILLKEFIKLNTNMEITLKNAKRMKLN